MKMLTSHQLTSKMLTVTLGLTGKMLTVTR